jgi:hypothetical protein
MGSQATQQPRKRAHREQRMAVTSIRIERDRLDAFKRVAAANRRSVSQQMRWLMDQSIEEHDNNGSVAA